MTAHQRTFSTPTDPVKLARRPAVAGVGVRAPRGGGARRGELVAGVRDGGGLRAAGYLAIVDVRATLRRGWLDELVRQVEFSWNVAASTYAGSAAGEDVNPLAADARCTLLCMLSPINDKRSHTSTRSCHSRTAFAAANPVLSAAAVELIHVLPIASITAERPTSADNA